MITTAFTTAFEVNFNRLSGEEHTHVFKNQYVSALDLQKIAKEFVGNDEVCVRLIEDGHQISVGAMVELDEATPKQITIMTQRFDTRKGAALRNNDMELEQAIKLIDECADINNQEMHDKRKTPLMTHIEKVHRGENHREIAKMLIKCGADVNLQDFNGKTALMKASESDEEIVDMLLRHRANVDIKNREGLTALMMASRKWGRSNSGKRIFAKLLEQIFANSRENGVQSG
jgi:hypothetical protein